MFTGLVEDLGRLARRTAAGGGARLRVETTLGKAEPFSLGESIAVDGVCLTVVSIDVGAGAFEADASAETLARTSLGQLSESAPVNLERAMKLGGRMGGHLVTGHVDGVGALLAREPDSGSVRMTFRIPARLAPFVAEKGSIAVNGVSLTVNGVGPDRFDVTIIPHTLAVTSLGNLTATNPVNLEVDLVARYVARLVEVGGRAAAKNDAEWLERLSRAGYM
jgi:riboflavin synthase